ncbi:Sorting nexin 1 [Rhynchospora pubera]|uniref:Sorting nexin 1 n=1 Tax=Rhynchospora pubera TaxID=906938 RepID=A0AAV8H0G9_9POAL|nr:Sorting nexin 1 [Rhynchospora pubera]
MMMITNLQAPGKGEGYTSKSAFLISFRKRNLRSSKSLLRNCAFLPPAITVKFAMISTESDPPAETSSPGPRSPSGQPFVMISVTEPVKMGTGVQSYISYRVITKSNMTEFEGPEKIVIRRYSDFEWLHDKLAEKYKGIFIPPLPEKSAVEKFRFSAEFIEMRRQALDVFINRIASHPVLRKSEDLRTFLLEEEERMERIRSIEAGIFSKKSSDIFQMFKDVQSKVSDVVLGKEKPVEESDPEYEKLKNYIFELENHLAETQKQAFRLVKRHRDLGQSLADFGKAMKLLGACEGESLGKAFSDLGSKGEILSLKLQKEAHNLLMNFEEPLKDYVRAVQSIKATMADRANAFRQHCELAETTKLKEINLDKLMLMHSERAREAEIDFKESKADSEEATKRFEAIVKTMNEELARFQEQKTADLGLAFHEFAKGQAKLAHDIADAWRGVLPKLEAL